MTSVRSMRVRHRVHFVTASGATTEPELVPERIPSNIEDYPEGATRLVFDDVIELILAGWNVPNGPIYSPPVNQTSYHVVYGDKEALRAYIGKMSHGETPAVHPSLIGKVWLINGLEDPPTSP